MFRSGPLEEIPANGAFDLSNTLLDRSGGIFKRGGTSYRSDAFGTDGLRFIWDGWLAGGQKTLIGGPNGWAEIASGGHTSLGGSGLTVAGRPAVYEGKIYLPGGNTYDGTSLGFYGPSVAASGSTYYAAVANRILMVVGSKVFFSKIGKPAETDATDFWSMPGGVEILGLEPLRQSAAVFTTSGLYVIGNLGHELTDEDGNLQQTLDLYDADLVLWGNGGIAAWEGSLIVPGTGGVYLLSLGVSSERGGPVRISDPIVELYQEYVRSGFSPGQATVYQNHYLLPILGGGDVVDVLVCRLDLPLKDGRARPWTHLSGAGAKVGALATRVISGFSRTPELIGALYTPSNARAITCNYFQPSANTQTEHDGSVARWSMTTRAYTTGNLVPNLVQRLRTRYQLTGSSSPTIEGRISTESEVPEPGAGAWGTSFIWGVSTWNSPGNATYDRMEGEAPVSLDGVRPFAWHVRRKVRFASFRLSCADPVSQLQVQSLEVFIRPEGRI